MNNVLMSVVALLLVGNVAMATWRDARYDDLVFTIDVQREHVACPEADLLDELHARVMLLQKELRHLDFVHEQCI